jgi:hypothetical protein
LRLSGACFIERFSIEVGDASDQEVAPNLVIGVAPPPVGRVDLTDRAFPEGHQATNASHEPLPMVYRGSPNAAGYHQLVSDAPDIAEIKH